MSSAGLTLEHPELRVAVRLEGPVAVEVVGLEIEEDADARLQRMHVLELERGELADDPRVVGDRADERRQRATDVAGDLDRPPGGTEDRAEELARGRLAVRPRDAEDRVREEPRAELDLAPHGDGALARARDEQRLARDSRALHDEIDPL